MRERLFVIGIGGLTGSKIVELAKNDFEIYGSYNFRNPKFEFVNQYQLNLMNFEKLNEIITSIKPNIIINTSAINNVDYCENHKDIAENVNVNAVTELKKICTKKEIKLVHLSSDSVFDGTKDTPYIENDLPNPINYYGKTKRMGEKIVLENPNNLIIRSSVLYGWLPKNLAENQSSSMKNMNFAQWLIQKLKNNEKVKIITDEFSSPIIVDDLSQSILNLIKNDKKGIFHSAPKIRINRYEFSKKIAQKFNFNSEMIIPITNKELGRNVKTALNKCLDSNKITKETGFTFLSLDDSIKLLYSQFN